MSEIYMPAGLTAPKPPRTRPRRLPAKAAFWLQVSMLVAFLAGSSAPTPLYAVYQAKWGFSPITVTVVFGIYALAVLTALLTVGSLSDHIGRKPVLLAAVVVQAVVMVIFATAHGVPALIVARVIQGLSTGAAVGALGAGLLDIDKTRGTVASAVAPMSGTATGALVSALLVQYVASPTHVIYIVLGGLFVIQALGVAFMSESSSPRAGALASLRPQFALPAVARRPMLTAIPALVAAWSLAGFYGSLGPALMHLISGSDSVVLGGAALFVLAGSAALTILVMRETAAPQMMLLGTAGLVIGVGITVIATLLGSLAVFFAGAVVAGAGFGGAFQGGLRTVVPLARAHERAGVLSVVFVVSYLAMGLPAIIGGYFVVHGGGVMDTAREYGVTVMVLAAMALLALVRGARAERDRDNLVVAADRRDSREERALGLAA